MRVSVAQAFKTLGSLHVNSFHMILHVVHPAEDSFTSSPFAWYSWIVFRFVSSSIFVATEASFSALRASVVTAEEVFAVSIEVFAKVTSACKYCFGVAAWVRAAPIGGRLMLLLRLLRRLLAD